MYVPPAFAQLDLDELYQVIEQRSFATLITQDETGAQASHIPLVLQREPGSYGWLEGHFAKVNSQATQVEQTPVLAIFHGPHAYVSPGWYETNAAVPTWNYVAVHVHGKLQAITDQAQKLQMLNRMVDTYEANLPRPWSLADADPAYVQKLINAIVPFRIRIESIVGQLKLSQNHPAERRERVIAGLDQTGKFEAQQVAALMRKSL